MVEVIEQIGGIKFADLRLYAIVLFTCCIFIVVSSFVDMRTMWQPMQRHAA